MPPRITGTFLDEITHDIPSQNWGTAQWRREFELYSKKPFVGGRKPNFIYFGGGTPSYLSARQLQSLRDRLHASVSWDDAEEVTFECEPGTLTDHKLKTIRELGVTRLSLGVENFSDHILDINGRAHRSRAAHCPIQGLPFLSRRALSQQRGLSIPRRQI